MSYLERVETVLQTIRDAQRYRAVQTHHLGPVVDFSSNDYLGLSTDPQVLQAFRHATRAGSGGARLLGGRHREHSLLEEELAAWLGRERVLLFSSGYLAALGAVAALSRTVQTIYSDELNHASLIDGIRLSHADRVVYPHASLPPAAQRRTPALVVTESIFSMDGDAVDLNGMLAELGDDDVLLIDEAHALGVAGEAGTGLAATLRDPRVVVLGTLSKSFGLMGGFVAGPAPVIELLVNVARTFIFDTALPPAVALAARVSLVQIRKGEALRRRLHENVARMRLGVASLGFPTVEGPAPIVPVVLGDESRAVAVSKGLLARNVIAPAIRPPTVPAGSSRLRLSLRADQNVEAIDLFVEGLSRCIVTS